MAITGSWELTDSRSSTEELGPNDRAELRFLAFSDDLSNDDGDVRLWVPTFTPPTYQGLTRLSHTLERVGESFYNGETGAFWRVNAFYGDKEEEDKDNQPSGGEVTEFEFAGETLTLPEMAKFAEHPDRSVRHNAARQRWEYFGENVGQFLSSV